MRNTSKRYTERGFSLVELLIVMTLLGIMAGMAAPSLSGVLEANRVQRSLDRLSADIAYTRMQAVRDGRSMSIAFAAPASYAIRDAAGVTLRTVNLASEAPGLTLAPANTVLGFNSRGLRTDNSYQKIRATLGTRTVAMMVSGIGRVYREY